MIGRRTGKDDLTSAMIFLFLFALVAWQIVSIFQLSKTVANPDASYSDNL